MADRGERRVLVDGASDERLVALARAGDEQAFAAIVERYRVPLLRYCHRYLPPSAAEDALQQTFINAYAALSGDTARTPVSLRPWLYRVAHNAALNVARDPQAGLDPLPEGLDGVERPDEVVQRRERLRRVVGAVSALPPNQRHVIVRNSLDGESHERIATDLGVSAGSIRQLAHRARRTVREAAAGLLPTPLLRLLPLGDAPLAGGGTLAKVAVAAVVAGAAGGGAVEVARHDAGRPERDTASVARAPARGAAASPAGLVQSAPGGVRSVPVSQDRATSKARRRSSGDDASGKRSGGSDSSGRGSSGSGSDERDSSGSGSSGSGSSGPGSGGDSSGSGSSGSGSSGSGSSGSGSSGSGSSGSGSSGSGSSGSGSSGSGSSGSGSSGSGSSGSGSSGSGSSGSGSSGSGSSGSGSSGSGSSGSAVLAEPTPALTPVSTPDSSGHGSGSSGSGSRDSGLSD